MKTIHLTPGQARHLFPSLFDHAITRRRLGLPYSQADATLFDEDLFVISGPLEFTNIPLPAHVKIEGADDDAVLIINADSLPKEITAFELTLDNSAMDQNRMGWDASVIQTVSCGSLRLINPEKFPRFVQARNLHIERSEEAVAFGKLDFGSCQITLTKDCAFAHLSLLATLAKLPTESVASLVIYVADLELDVWAELPIIQKRWCEVDRQTQARIGRVVGRYKELRLPKRRLEAPQKVEPTESAEFQVELQ